MQYIVTYVQGGPHGQAQFPFHCQRERVLDQMFHPVINEQNIAAGTNERHEIRILIRAMRAGGGANDVSLPNGFLKPP